MPFQHVPHVGKVSMRGFSASRSSEGFADFQAPLPIRPWRIPPPMASSPVNSSRPPPVRRGGGSSAPPFLPPVHTAAGCPQLGGAHHPGGTRNSDLTSERPPGRQSSRMSAGCLLAIPEARIVGRKKPGDAIVHYCARRRLGWSSVIASSSGERVPCPPHHRAAGHLSTLAAKLSRIARRLEPLQRPGAGEHR